MTLYSYYFHSLARLFLIFFEFVGLDAYYGYQMVTTPNRMADVARKSGLSNENNQKNPTEYKLDKIKYGNYAITDPNVR
jgi:hypothetical protein